MLNHDNWCHLRVGQDAADALWQILLAPHSVGGLLLVGYGLVGVQDLVQIYVLYHRFFHLAVIIIIKLVYLDC